MILHNFVGNNGWPWQWQWKWKWKFTFRIIWWMEHTEIVKNFIRIWLRIKKLNDRSLHKFPKLNAMLRAPKPKCIKLCFNDMIFVQLRQLNWHWYVLKSLGSESSEPWVAKLWTDVQPIKARSSTCVRNYITAWGSNSVDWNLKLLQSTTKNTWS